jgi:hypothetical protein
MNHMARFLVGSGFVWIAAWALLGSLLGARINWSLWSEDIVWLESQQRALLRTAHAHMNSMSFAVILMGLSYSAAVRFAPQKYLHLACYAALLGIPLFGSGLVLEAFFPTVRNNLSPLTLLTAAGGTLAMGAFFFWGLLFLGGVRRK